jgi:carboxylesterase type B
LLLFVPKTVSVGAGSKVPTILWIHGGSFIEGSATAAGLDGSKLAVATNSIVAVVQYRLGGVCTSVPSRCHTRTYRTSQLGFLAPNGVMNLGVKDIVTAMNFLNTVLPSFGGVANKITLAGQSSGATMIRALLAASSVSSLFQSAILQSDPMVSLSRHVIRQNAK